MRLALGVALLFAASAWAQTRALVPLASCVPVQGPATLYLAPGTCVDATEAAVAVPVKALANWTNLSCRLGGGTSGSATVTIRARTGACGSLADAAFTCTIGAGAQSCDTGTTFLGVAPGQCLAWSVVISQAMPGTRTLLCTVERAA